MIKSKYIIRSIKAFKINAYNVPCKLCLVLMAIMLLLAATDTFGAEKKKKKKKKQFDIQFGLATTYDNNILKYSEKYLNRFMHGLDSGRFHIKTYDDLIVNPSISGTYTFNIFKQVKSKVNASISPKFYVVNNIKNWLFWSVGFQQYFSKRGSVKIFYSYIPEFYVRHFRDDAWVDAYGYTAETFQPYAFSKDNFGSYIQNTFFKNTRLRFTFNYSRYYHNEYYTEYDSKNFFYGIKLYQPLHKNVKLTVGYTYIESNAKGYDAAYQTPDSTTGPDATYAEDIFTLGVTWKLPKLAKRSNNIDFDFYFMKRYYSSPYHPLVDPLHAGRVDDNYRMFITYNIYLPKYFKLSVYYNFLMRDSDTKAKINSLFVSNEKDYRQSQAGFKLVYSLRF